MDNYTKTKYRYFFLSLTLSFFVLSMMFLVLMNAAHPRIPESLTREPETEADSVYVPTAADALSILFIGTSGDDASAGTFILARFDPARGKVPIVALPPQTAVHNSGRTEPLSEVYRYGGAEYTRNALAETLGVPVDRYARIRLDAFISCAAAVGSVEYELAEPITVTRGEAAFTLSAGRQLLDGQKVSDVIRYGGYPGGELERCAVTAGLTAAIVNQRMDVCLSTVVDSVFEKVINLISTDISYNDYYERKRAAQFLAKLGEDPGTPLTVSGEFSEDGTYAISDTFLALLSQHFR